MAIMKDIFGGINTGGTFAGWQLINQSAKDMPKEIKEAVIKAQEGYTGATFKPLWLIGAQLVNGMNYLLICDSIVNNIDKTIVGLVVNVPFNGEAKIVRVIDTNKAEVPAAINALYGAAKKVLNSANTKLLFYIGSQVVKGINYYVIAEVKPLRNGDPYAALVTINMFDGEATIKIDKLK